LIPGDVLIAASSLKNKDQLLERMKEHQQQQQAQQAQQAPLVAAHGQAIVAGLQAKADADKALATERIHNTVHSIAEVHGMHNQLMQPPDPPSAPGTSGAPEMSPEMALEHHIADLRVKHAAAGTNEAKAALIARQAGHETHRAVATIAGTHATAVNTARTAATPIPQPQPQGPPA
jgi:alkylation response protein AidB-like acyl-CoA dehydrogenase